MRPVEMPIAAAIRRFCVTARIRRPNDVARRAICRATKTAIASAMIQRRLVVICRPAQSNAPDMKAGCQTWRLLAPNRLRTACCRISDTPQVASSVSSGRP